ncbi:MAG: DinB family protein [Ktedonobacterales bacterium]
MPSDDPEARKADLLDRVRAAHARLEWALAALSPEQMEAEGTVGGWSAKATLGHITWWEHVPLHALRGEPDEDILAGEEWNTDRANAVLFERNQARPLDDVLTAFRASYTEMLRELEVLPATRLDETGPYGGSLFEVIMGNTYAHYDEHTNLLAAAFGLRVAGTP